ncbi:gas vesicle protein GvpG [Nesterenkonia pannonica]|uniref:gas vesicle protein GvpG n=1 Tax=Nesterenkonia pannonica TaxID=1548602 RepID=UPI0021646D38|nr:gas vesicle protein GvpG [Nesterenkonia pannonica]
MWLAEQIAQEAEQQHYDPHTIRRQLLEVENARNAGELSEDEAAALERELIARLMEASQRRNPTRRTHE